MNKQKIGKWILGIIGALILGALGNGVWEFALKDVCSAVGRGILTGLSLGFGNLRDSCYVQIAQGNTDRASLYILFILMATFFGYAGFHTGVCKSRRETEDAEEAGKPFIDPKATLPEIKEKIRVLKRQARMWENVSLLCLALFLSTLAYRVLTLSYISSAICHYEQSYNICLPLLSDSERLSIRSEFAQIKNKDDYVRVLQKLQTLAVANKIELPAFQAW